MEASGGVDRVYWHTLASSAFLLVSIGVVGVSIRVDWRRWRFY